MKDESHITKWKHLIPPITEELLLSSFRTVFECDPSDAEITVAAEEIMIKTKKKTILHGGFGYHTDQPKLKDYEDIYHRGAGCSWGVDDDGVRYYYLDRSTGMPKDWDEVVAIEVVYRYIQSLNKPKELNHV